ncbi:MAG: putative DNA binding domain-containing protein [Bacteroidales bacterium]|nr:putative DNA binding domain-containing protein [Bacteroidales bacterium]
MEVKDLQYLINESEGLRIEFKDAKDSVPSSFYETVVSFSNTDGGTILLGVNDSGKITGIAPEAEVSLKKNIITALNSRDCIDPPVYIQPFTIKHPDGLVMVVQIPASSQIHNHAGKVYSRDFESDLDVTNNQLRISDLYLRKRNFFTESNIYPHLSMSDLDDRLFEKAYTLIRNNKSDHPWLMADKEQLLREASLWRKDFHTRQEGLTLAAALIFGKNETIQSILPAYKVEGMVRIQNKDRYDDRIYPPLRTNLIDSYLELKAFVSKHLPEKFFMEGDQRIDLRDKIFREVIGNAIVHREYTSALSSELIIYKSEVVITNPNKPIFHGIIDPLGFNPYPKNPNIRKFFTAFGWTDEIGSGVRNTNKYLPLYTQGAHPVFIENDVFKTIIPLSFVSLQNYAQEFIDWLELNTSFSDHVLDGLKQIELSGEYLDSSWKEVLLDLVPSWHQKGTELTALDWSDNQLFNPDAIKNVPSWDKKSTELLKKKNRYLIGILSLCVQPIGMTDLMIAFDYKNTKTFRDNYIKPLRETGFIVFTNPDKPTDPTNKYVITKQGKAFLGGLLK